VLLRAFVAEPLGVPTGSTMPTIRPGDHVLATLTRDEGQAQLVSSASKRHRT
jgi:signal peptidase I